MPALNQTAAAKTRGPRSLVQIWAGSRRLAWLALLLSLVVSAVRDAALLFRYPIAVGIDGYYYVLQINHLPATGRFYFSTFTPFVLYVLVVLTQLTHDAVTSVKIAGILLNSLLALGIFAIIGRLVRNLWFAVLGSVLALAPQSHLFMSGEYINNLGAVVLLLWSGWSFIRAFQTRRKIWIMLAVALLIAAISSHRSAVLIVLTFAGCCFLLRGLTLRGRWKGLGFLGIAVFWFVPALILVQPFISVPVWLQTEISIRPHWPFGAPVIPEELMLAISSPVLLFLIFKRLRKTSLTVFDGVFGSIALWSLIITLNPFLDPQAVLSGLAGRLRVLAYLQVALIVPAVIWLAYSVRNELALYFAAALVPLLILSILAPLPYGLQPEFLARRERLIQALRLHAGELGRHPIVIARHGDQFAVTATIGVPAQHSPPANPQDATVYWLLDEVSDQVLGEESVVLISNAGTATLLAEDTVLRRRLQAMSITDRRRLLRANPTLAIAAFPG